MGDGACSKQTTFWTFVIASLQYVRCQCDGRPKQKQQKKVCSVLGKSLAILGHTQLLSVHPELRKMVSCSLQANLAPDLRFCYAGLRSSRAPLSVQGKVRGTRYVSRDTCMKFVWETSDSWHFGSCCRCRSTVVQLALLFMRPFLPIHNTPFIILFSSHIFFRCH
jgi:hypothetical protein